MNLRHRLAQLWLVATMRSSADYWERRYRLGLTSGRGSEGTLARYKAEALNNFVAAHGIERVIEFGCGDGQQLTLAKYPRYLGLDVSAQAIELCRARFGRETGRSFLKYDPDHSVNLGGYVAADLALSLDVVYHLVEDSAYDAHLRDLFGVSRRFVIIYGSNKDAPGSHRHVRHRGFVADVARRFPQFHLSDHWPNPHRDLTFADFYIFARSTDGN